MTAKISPELAADLATGHKVELCVSLDVPSNLKDAAIERFFWLTEFAKSVDARFISTNNASDIAALFISADEKSAAFMAKLKDVLDIRKATLWDRTNRACANLLDSFDYFRFEARKTVFGLRSGMNNLALKL